MARYFSKSIREDLMQGSRSVSGSNMAKFIKEDQDKRQEIYAKSFVAGFRDGGVSGPSGKTGGSGVSGQTGTLGTADTASSYNQTTSTSSFAGQSVPEKVKLEKKKIDHNITEYKWKES